MVNPYLDLTAEFNRGRLRALVSSGQGNLWLEQAQATNDLDEALYSHGVFERDPAVRRD